MLQLFLLLGLALAAYNENLTLQPLPRNKLLALFEFLSLLPAFALEYSPPGVRESRVRHYGSFPGAIEPIITGTNTRQLHLRFTQGWWDSEAWGALPRNGSRSGGTGVELLAVIEAASPEDAAQAWTRLASELSGFYCALLNFIDSSITTFPRHSLLQASEGLVANPENGLFYMRSTLPNEPICTENLTPFLKMLPTRGKAGVASLLDGHKLYDSLWHSMSIDLSTRCDQDGCHLDLEQNIHHVIDVVRLLRRRRESGVPKPAAGDNLRCDPTKKLDAWVCFPLPDSTEVLWSLEELFGRSIKGSGFEDSESVTTIDFVVDNKAWDVKLRRSDGPIVHVSDVTTSQTLKGVGKHDFTFSTKNSSNVIPRPQPPLVAARSLTGYSQDKGGIRTILKNPGKTVARAVYYETLPWFMRVYLHTFQVLGSGVIESQFFRPALDRKRPGHLELEVSIPPGGEIVLTYEFDNSLLLYAEYPPDANHGFAISPAVIKTLTENADEAYEMRTTSLLLTLPTPDFSMPYNVIILTCTVMSLAFGTVFNLLTKKIVTEEEFEEMSRNSKVVTLRTKLRGLLKRKST